MGINLREEGAPAAGRDRGIGRAGLGVMSAARHFDIRAYRVTNPGLVNKTVGELEALPKDTGSSSSGCDAGKRFSRTTPTNGHPPNDRSCPLPPGKRST